MKDVWHVVETAFDIYKNKGFEGLCTQGSSYFHVRASLEEGLHCAPQDEEYMRLPANVTLETPRHPISKTGCYLPGITGAHPLLREEAVNLPSPICFGLHVGEERFDMCQSHVEQYRRALCLKNGILTRTMVWHTRQGAQVTCEFTRFVSRDEPHLLWQTVTLTADRPCDVQVTANIDETVKTNGFQHATGIQKIVTKNRASVFVTTDTGDTVRMETLLLAPYSFVPVWEDHLEGFFDLAAGKPLTIRRLTALSSSLDEKETDLEAELTDAMGRFDQLRENHERVWASLWASCHIEIEGDDEAQYALNVNLYHMLRVSHPAENRVAVCAKGFAGEAYFGHFFWDSEVYLLPMYLYTMPEAGRALTEYRIHSLPGACANAKAYGYSGARYAWEASVDGREQCPNWQYCDHEVHVTADVVFGLWHDFVATGDRSFLRRAFPVFVQTARYWAERVTRWSDGRVSLDGVMGPDEYICLCNNNAYTNALVKIALDCTRRAAALLDITLEPFLLDEINEICEKLPLPTLPSGLVAQCDRFDEYAEPAFQTFWPDRSKPFGTCVSQERNYRVKALKQADTLMLPFICPDFFDEAQLAAHFDYYEPYTTHDSSLSYAVHATLAARLGRVDMAKEFFDRARVIDLDGGAAEGVHIANCGGLWQAVVMGFCGLKPAYAAEKPVFTPQLPTAWKSVRFPLIFGGKRYHVHVTREGVTLRERGTIT